MVEGARFNHLSFSRSKVGRPGVKEPRHFVLYRRRGDVLEVARILHDTCTTLSDIFQRNTGAPARLNGRWIRFADSGPPWQSPRILFSWLQEPNGNLVFRWMETPLQGSPSQGLPGPGFVRHVDGFPLSGSQF